MTKIKSMVLEIGKELGRSAADMQKHLDLLADNWFDTPESLKTVSVQDLQNMGMPWRLAELLLNRVNGTSSRKDDDAPRNDRPKPSAWAVPEPPAPAPRRDGRGGAQNDRHEQGGEDRSAYKDKIRLGCEHIDKGFKFVGKIMGEKGVNLDHIRKKCGAKVCLAGHGSHHAEPDGKESKEPLHIKIEAPDNDTFHRAYRMADDLIRKVHDDYESWCRAGDRDDRTESRTEGKGKGKSSGGKDKNDKGKRSKRDDDQRDRGQYSAGHSNSGGLLPEDAGELTHTRMVKLLKVLQRNKAFKPEKAVLALWNEFSDARAPMGPDGTPFRDPVRLDMELIIEFLVRRIPRPFFPILVRKLQSEGVDDGIADCWHEFCDRCAPAVDARGGDKITRDPKLLDPELLLAFVSSLLDTDKDRKCVEIIDNFGFDFEDRRGDRRDDGRDGRDTRDRQDNQNSRDDREGDDRGKGRGKKGKDGKKGRNVNGADREFTEVIEFEEGLDPAFPFGSRVIGKEGRNVKHIREHTGAYVWLGGQGSGRLELDTNEESPRPFHVKVTADDQEGLDKALQIARDLIDSVYEEYHEWLEKKDEEEPETNSSKQGGDGKGKGKNRGKGRRGSNRDDERAEKRQRRD